MKEQLQTNPELSELPKGWWLEENPFDEFTEKETVKSLRAAGKSWPEIYQMRDDAIEAEENKKRAIEEAWEQYIRHGQLTEDGDIPLNPDNRGFFGFR